MSLGLSSHGSWWKDNGPGCDNKDLPAAKWQGEDSPALISTLGCVLEYQYIEVLHSALQLVISVSTVCSESAGYSQLLQPLLPPDIHVQ